MNWFRSFLRRTRLLDPAPKASHAAYAERVTNEKKAFAENTHVHDLPKIYSYWSLKYLVPKFQPFGITTVEQFFLLYITKFRERFPGAPIHIVSIGCGNCDIEVGLARRLVDSGICGFTIECTDINEMMLARGAELAAAQGVGQHIVPVVADFNAWKPRQTYDVIMACHSLHHVTELEHLFSTIRQALNPEGYFLTIDIIGRNGHMRWPEALALVQDFWKELPDSHRYNHSLQRHEPEYINHDCSTEGFEGIRAQDILPLLIGDFHFEFFAPFANIVMVFLDRPFGPNFDAEREWDRDFIDRVHARDEQGLLNGEWKPTVMGAVLRNKPVETVLLHPRLTPEFCVRDPQQR